MRRYPKKVLSGFSVIRIVLDHGATNPPRLSVDSLQSTPLGVHRGQGTRYFPAPPLRDARAVSMPYAGTEILVIRVKGLILLALPGGLRQLSGINNLPESGTSD